MPGPAQLPSTPSGGGEESIYVGPVVPPSLSYAIKSYMPYLVVLVVIPLVGVLYLWLRTIYYARRGEYLQRPDHPVYSVYLIGGLFPIIGGAAVLYKIVADYVYGHLPMWRWIRAPIDLYTYQRIAEFLSHFYLLSGLVIGLSTLLILLRKYYENWYIDLAVYLGTSAWFLYLTPLPLKKFKYTTNFMKTHNIPAGSLPYNMVSPLLHERLAIGVAIGLAMSASAYLYYRRSIARSYRS